MQSSDQNNGRPSWFQGFHTLITPNDTTLRTFFARRAQHREADATIQFCLFTQQSIPEPDKIRELLFITDYEKFIH